MNSDVKYFRIGVFVITAFFLLLFGVFILGARSWFEPKIKFETYFNSSIGSLNVGEPVKYRGITLGKVTGIDLTSNIYTESRFNPAAKNNYQYIIVEFEVKKKMIQGLMKGDLQANLNLGAQKGFRARVDMSSIVGGSYLELDQVDSNFLAPELKYNWQTRYYYIPSTDSTITQIVNSLNETLLNLGKVNFDEIQRRIVTLAGQLDENSQQLTFLIQKINRMDLSGTFNNVRIITEELKDTSSRIKNDPSQILWSAPPPPAKSLGK